METEEAPEPVLADDTGSPEIGAGGYRGIPGYSACN